MASKMSSGAQKARTTVWLAFAALLLTACPTQQSSETKLGECKKFGETCQFAPGKLGTCVVTEPCPTSDCFACQSQH
jgi:hypothetical protein